MQLLSQYQMFVSGCSPACSHRADDSGGSGGSDEEPGDSEGARPAWGRLAWPRPPRRRRGSWAGSGLEDELEDEEEGEGEEDEAAQDWDDDLGGFVVEDEDTAAAAFAEL